MKRVGYIYEKIYDIDNIKNAIRKSSKGKRDRKHQSPNEFIFEDYKILID